MTGPGLLTIIIVGAVIVPGVVLLLLASDLGSFRPSCGFICADPHLVRDASSSLKGKLATVPCTRYAVGLSVEPAICAPFDTASHMEDMPDLVY